MRKKTPIRKLYDAGSRLEIQAERLLLRTIEKVKAAIAAKKGR